MEDNKKPSSIQVNFGKHKGATLGDLALSDRSYVQWLANQDQIKGSSYFPNMARKILAETAEAAKKLDKYDLDSRYRQEYSEDEIEQMRREDREMVEHALEQERLFDEQHFACRWRNTSGRQMTIYVFNTEEPISVYLDDMPVDGLDFKVTDLRDMTPEEAREPSHREIVAVLDNKQRRVGLTLERKTALLLKLQEVTGKP